MELKDFIRETLVGIARGIEEAKIETGDVWAITPATVEGEKVVDRNYVEFDIAVIAGESSSSRKDGRGSIKGEIAVLGAKVGGGVDGSANSAEEKRSENVSRVSFKVPVQMNMQFNNPVAQKAREDYFMKKNAANASTE